MMRPFKHSWVGTPNNQTPQLHAEKLNKIKVISKGCSTVHWLSDESNFGRGRTAQNKNQKQPQTIFLGLQYMQEHDKSPAFSQTRWFPGKRRLSVSSIGKSSIIPSTLPWPWCSSIISRSATSSITSSASEREEAVLLHD